MLRILSLGRGFILCTKQVVDGGLGLLSNLVCRRRRLPSLLVVAGEVWEFLKKQDVFMLCYVIKQPYYSVHIYMCIPEIYVTKRFI